MNVLVMCVYVSKIEDLCFNEISQHTTSSLFIALSPFLSYLNRPQWTLDISMRRELFDLCSWKLLELIIIRRKLSGAGARHQIIGFKIPFSSETFEYLS